MYGAHGNNHSQSTCLWAHTLTTGLLYPPTLRRWAPWSPISAQPAIDMYWSDAMALFVVVGILDLAQAYMEPMETTTVNLHASGHTY